MKKTIVVATRPSQLAYKQTVQTVKLLKKANSEITFDIQKISTKGDRVLDRSLTEFGGTGLFVKELEQALLERRADIAVHSLKDMPAKQPSKLVLSAFPEREDTRDALLQNKNWQGENFVVGTGSPRRQLQIVQMYRNVVFKDIRGNIDTRIRKLKEGQYDAIVLAVAGLKRLGLAYNPKEIIAVEDCLPAAGQGALGIQCRKGDDEIIHIARRINHDSTEKAVLAERIFLETIQGGCKFPMAAYAVCNEKTITLEILIGELKTNRFIREKEKFSFEETEQRVIAFAERIKQECRIRRIKIEVV